MALDTSKIDICVTCGSCYTALSKNDSLDTFQLLVTTTTETQGETRITTYTTQIYNEQDLQTEVETSLDFTDYDEMCEYISQNYYNTPTAYCNCDCENNALEVENDC